MATISPAYTLTVGEDYDPVLINAIFSALTIGTILGSEIASGTITGSNIASATITGSNITANTIGSTHIAANSISADHIQSDAVTATKIQSGSVTTDKLYAGAVTAEKMSVTTLSSISANLGEVTAGTLTAPTIQTSANPAVSRVLMNSTGIIGYSATLGQTFRLPVDGSAPQFVNGTIESCTIIDSMMISNDFKTSNVLPWVELATTGVAYRESGSGGLYGTAVYGTDTYGAGVTGYYGNSAKPLLSVEKERPYADIHLYNRTSIPTGAALIGDFCVVDGKLYRATANGNYRAAGWKPIYYSEVGFYIKAGQKLYFDAA